MQLINNILCFLDFLEGVNTKMEAQVGSVL